MKTLSLNESERIARLARLHFSPEDAEKINRELSQIIAFADALEALSVDDALPFSPEGQPQNRLRADRSVPSLSREAILQNAPQSDGACFLVPRTVEEGTE